MVDANGDGIDDALQGAGRMVATAAAQAGEVLASQLAHRQRQQAQQARDDAARMRDQLEAQRAGVRAQLAAVQNPAWWDGATPDEVVRVAETARIWRGEDPAAVSALGRIDRELRQRYNVTDPDRALSDPATLQAAIAEGEKDRQQRRKTAAEDAADAATVVAAEPAVEAVVDQLEAEPVQPELDKALTPVEASFPEPATEATRAARAPKARKSSTSHSRSRQRTR